MQRAQKKGSETKNRGAAPRVLRILGVGPHCLSPIEAFAALHAPPVERGSQTRKDSFTGNMP